MGAKRIRFMCTAFRDGFQSVYGARVLTKDFLPALEAARDAGIQYFEAGGGARFQALYFYCDEDAFDMMDTFRATVGPDADLQTLSRGANVVGLESQSSDVIDLHARLFKKHGISTIRNFDALNDVNNLIYSGRCIKNAGLKHQVVVTVMQLPPGFTGAHDPDFYVNILQQILDAEIDFDSVCFKDASGTLTPRRVHETIARAKKMLPGDVAVHYHTHDTAGTGTMCYLAALEGGADCVDLSLAPASGGTCQTDVAVMWHALRDTEFDLDVDIEKVLQAEEVFKECMKDYFLPPEALRVEPLIPWSPMPGGALTANTQMLRDNKIMDRYPEIIRAMGEVVLRGGFGTSVTPVSQFYFQQAFNNVMFGPWEKIADGYGKMVLGYFGRTPVKPDPEIVAIAAKQLELEPTDRTPLEINDADPTKGLAPARKRLEEAGLPVNDENLFISATCKEKGVAFLKGEAKVMIRKKSPEEAEDAPSGGKAGSGGYIVTVNGRTFAVNLDRDKAVIDGREYSFDVRAADASAPAAGGAAGGATGGTSGEPVGGKQVTAPMPGLVLRVVAPLGARVAAGETILVIEAMKMEVEIKAPAAGSVNLLAVSQGDQVSSGQVLANIG